MAVECQVSKVWEFNDEEGVVIIYHHGIHTCVPRASSAVSTETLDDATSKFQTIKKLGPMAYASGQLIQAGEEGKSLDVMTLVALDNMSSTVLYALGESHRKHWTCL